MIDLLHTFLLLLLGGVWVVSSVTSLVVAGWLLLGPRP